MTSQHKIVSPRRRHLQHRIICNKSSMKDGHKYADIASFDCDNNIVFGPPEKITLPNNPHVQFTKIPLYNEIEPGVYSDVLFSTPPDIHCFGIKENLNMSTKVLEGFSLGMAVCDPRVNDPDERNFLNFLERLTKKCESFLLSDCGADINGEPINPAYVNNLCSALSYRMIEVLDSNGRVKKVRDPNKGPTLYAKLLTKRVDNDNWLMDTSFWENNVNTTNDAFSLYFKPMTIQAAIRAENIFLGAGTSKIIRIQFKVVEVTVMPENHQVRPRLLPATVHVPPAVSEPKQVAVNVNSFNNLNDEVAETESVGSDNNEEQ